MASLRTQSCIHLVQGQDKEEIPCGDSSPSYYCRRSSDRSYTGITAPREEVVPASENVGSNHGLIYALIMTGEGFNTTPALKTIVSVN